MEKEYKIYLRKCYLVSVLGINITVYIADFKL